MPDNNLLYSLLEPYPHANGSTGLFYSPIQRTGDLISASRLLNADGQRVQELFIRPPSTSLGRLPTAVIDELQDKLIFKTAPDANEIVSLEIEDLLELHGDGDPLQKSVLLKRLEEDGLTGELNIVASRLRQSRLGPIDQTLLSRNNIALYTYYRAAIGMNVRDADGIISNVFLSLNKVKAFINRRLVERVIEENNLEAEETEIALLKDRLAERDLSYEGKAAVRAILKEYEEVRDKGGLIAFINDFLDNGPITVPANINRDVLVKQMIDFLLESGFTAKTLIGLTAAFEVEKTGLKVMFTDKSRDGGTIVKWRWEFGDGGISGAQNPSNTYKKAGRFVVKLTVTDDDENTNWVEQTISIYYVKGIVKQNKTPLVGAIVRAFDQDPRNPLSQLGTESQTDSKGAFAIYYDDADVKTEHPNSPRPDIVVKIYDEQSGDELHTTSRVNNADYGLDLGEIDI